MITPLFIVSLAVSVVATVGVLGMIVILGFCGRTQAAGKAIPDRQEMRKHAVLGVFYVNPEDPRGWVPKLYGYGLTVNLRRKSFAVTFVVLIALLLASTVCVIVFRPR